MSIRNKVRSLVFITGFALFFQNVFATEITQSPNDSRQYKSITLPNELEVLLISDKNSDKAAASLDVKIGSGSDPKGYEGLAHFLEHMLFLGTKKYPEAGSYQAYINKHGGSHNAYTSFENTNYFFDINADSLEPALDRFSQQFVAPTFTAKYVTREINAVHSEYSAKLKDDSRLYFSAFKQTINPAHPYHNFAVGNLTTLSTRDDKDIRNVLIEFYKKNYSANQMKLVVLGKEPIHQLEAWVSSKFSAIPNNKTQGPKFDMPMLLEHSLPSLLEVSPTMDKRTLSLVFPIPSTKKQYRNKPTYVISNLIGHEGKGSLFASLKKQGLVESLSAGTGIDTGWDAMFNISFRLTQKGLSNWEAVVAETFSYIALIKSEGINKRYFDEQKSMLNLAFEFSEKSEPIHYVSSLASTLHEVDTTDILQANYLMDTFEPKRYKAFLDQLNPNNVQISIMSKSVVTDKKTKWYDAPYSYKRLSPEQIKLFTTTAKRENLKLPDVNDFIPDNIDIISSTPMPKPELLEKSEGFSLWHYYDTSFGTPKSNIYVNLRSPVANNTAEHAVLNSLFTSMVQDELNEYTYPAYLAGLNYDLYSHIRGISIKIGGYSEKQTLLLENILRSIKTVDLKKERFNIYKDQMIRSLENAAKKKPYQQTTGEIRKLVLRPQWSEAEKLVAIDLITIDTLKAFKQRLLSKVEIVALSSGNISRAGSLNIASIVQSWMLNKETQKVNVERGEVARLPLNQSFSVELNIDHPDTGYTLYIQGKDKSYQEQVNFLFLSQILSSPYYERVRTENQLGYIVFATNYSFLEVPAIAFIVQSPNASANQLETETQAFLHDYTTQLASMPLKDFNQHKAALLSRLFEKENNLGQKSDRFWREIDRENISFDTREKLSKEINSLSPETFNQFYASLIQSSGKKLLVFSSGKNSKESTNNEKQEALDRYLTLDSNTDIWSLETPFK
ncbi:insulinase family protein [Alkalimarinus alittae]|uniref:Protease 3 n=1 Tax=Alkalimarinus alittae TaxID=2961619 RepID=A0ABY6MYJ3_9ALTE|nr:insulinase family protein [Alkalimarinus alittae]UZE94896.1 insulinase family protein [Alkalimarinus alittae]